ncbi:transposase [Spirosoma sp. SC4-14]|uniref:transposase n=1 Tax=Spirosoma sp. SC4-14 TaxID=3128900 RepID=UPI0030D4949E
MTTGKSSNLGFLPAHKPKGRPGFHRLKTGCQWRELPTKQFFTDKVLSWNAVFYYHNKWSKANCWKAIWLNLLSKNLKHLDLSSVEFDGSHTPAKNGGMP